MIFGILDDIADAATRLAGAAFGALFGEHSTEWDQERQQRLEAEYDGFQARQKKLRDEGWRPVDEALQRLNMMGPLDEVTRGLERAPRGELLEFMRAEWDEPKRFRLMDVPPEFNIAGLWWRRPVDPAA